MLGILKGLTGRAGRGAPVNGHEFAKNSPPAWSNEPGVRETRVYKVNMRGRKDRDKNGERIAGKLLGIAGLIIFGALVGSGFVAYEAQRLYALAHNHTGAQTTADVWRAAIIGGLPDAGWVAMALVALVAALRGQSSLRARIGVIMFFALSLGAQVLYAPKGIDGLLVAVIAPLTMAWMLETFIVEVRRWAGARRGLEMAETPILTGVLLTVVRIVRGLAGLLLWFVRLAFDRSGTWSGVRSWILDTAPLAPGRTLASQRAAEALELAEGATLTTRQVQQQAAADRLALAAQAEHDRQAAEQLLAQVKQEAAEQVAQAEQEAAEQVAQVKQEAARAVAQAHTEAERRVRALTETTANAELRQADLLHQRESELAKVTSERDRALVGAQRAQRAESDVRQVRAQLDETRRVFDLLCRYAGARGVLRAHYEALNLAGDQRYGDREAMPDLARDWAPKVGITEQTARRYLMEHISDPTAGTNQEGE
jgi:hypothetical protein